jgi:hypothetical protein
MLGSAAIALNRALRGSGSGSTAIGSLLVLRSSSSSTTTTTSRVFDDDDLADALKVAELAARVRARGHLVAQLDPLGRCLGGPWVGPVGTERDRCDSKLLAFAAGWREVRHDPAKAAVFAGAALGLRGPATASRTLPIGDLMPAAAADANANNNNKRDWTVPEAVDALLGRYCGTLAVEYDHLARREQAEWMRARFEGAPPLTDGERVGVLKRLLEVWWRWFVFV